MQMNMLEGITQHGARKKRLPWYMLGTWREQYTSISLRMGVVILILKWTAELSYKYHNEEIRFH